MRLGRRISASPGSHSKISQVSLEPVIAQNAKLFVCAVVYHILHVKSMDFRAVQQFVFHSVGTGLPRSLTAYSPLARKSDTARKR